jgi:transposase
MAHRYRLYPTDGQVVVLVRHCADARYVWNLALEQANCWRRGRRSTPGDAERQRQLAEARKDSWLGEGSSSVQQAALRDFDQAMRNWWAGTHRRPTWRKAGIAEGFVIRDLVTVQTSRRWARVHVPKLGPVRFRLSRPLPEGTRSARVTLDRAGRWHVSFTALPPPIHGPGDGTIVGVDRGIVIPFACSDGTGYDSGGLSDQEKATKRRLQRHLARQKKGSNRRQATKARIARLAAKGADRRKDAIEKVTTDLARRADIVRVEDLNVARMMRSAGGTADHPGRNVAAKAGLNRSIAEQGWAMFARRLADKIGDRLELVPAAYTSQHCPDCGHTTAENRESQAVFCCVQCGYQANADLVGALNVAAGRAVKGRGGTRAVRRPGEASTTQVA